MEATMTRPAVLEGYEAFARRLEHQPAGVAALRRAGRERFEEVGFPSTRQEEWRHTNVAPISRVTFRRAEPGTAVDRARLRPFLVTECDDLVFVNGHFAPALSSTPRLPAGAFAGSLAVALRERPEIVLAHLGRHADVEKNPFVALNAAHVDDGAFVYVPRGAVVERSEMRAVYVVAADGRVSLRQVRLGRTRGDSTEILAGLAIGDQVAVNPAAAAARVRQQAAAHD